MTNNKSQFEDNKAEKYRRYLVNFSLKSRLIIHVFQGKKKLKTHILFLKNDEKMTDNKSQFEGKYALLGVPLLFKPIM